MRRIDRLFAVERDIAGLSAEARLAVRRERSAPILADLGPWLRQQQERLSRKSEVGKAIAYTTRRWEALTRFMSDGPDVNGGAILERRAEQTSLAEETSGPARAGPVVSAVQAGS